MQTLSVSYLASLAMPMEMRATESPLKTSVECAFLYLFRYMREGMLCAHVAEVTPRSSMATAASIVLRQLLHAASENTNASQQRLEAKPLPDARPFMREINVLTCFMES